jgi:hypothetical protein
VHGGSDRSSTFIPSFTPAFRAGTPSVHSRRSMSIGHFETGRGLLLQAGAIVLAVRVVLWVLPSATIVRIVRRVSDARAREKRAPRPPVERVTSAVEAVSRRIPQATCLTQALSAQLLLRRFGYDSRLCLGVARSPRGQFRAHAWLERDGAVVIGGAESSAFTRLPALSAMARRSSGAQATR